jgi:hypothetical protein
MARDGCFIRGATLARKTSGIPFQPFNGGYRARLLAHRRVREPLPGVFQRLFIEESFQSVAFPPCHKSMRLLFPVIALDLCKSKACLDSLLSEKYFMQKNSICQ